VPHFSKEQPHAVVYKEVRYHHILENLLKQTNDVKVIGLVRNPLATLYSWWQAPKEFRADLGWDFEEEWLKAPKKNLDKPEEFNGYLKWKEAALLFEMLHQHYTDRFYLVSYTSLLKETEQTVQELFAFALLEYLPQTAEFLTQSKARKTADAYGVYKIKSDDTQWESQLPESIVKFVHNDLQGTILEKYLA
jgi:hypothetical protein